MQPSLSHISPPREGGERRGGREGSITIHWANRTIAKKGGVVGRTEREGISAVLPSWLLKNAVVSWSGDGGRDGGKRGESRSRMRRGALLVVERKKGVLPPQRNSLLSPRSQVPVFPLPLFAATAV